MTIVLGPGEGKDLNVLGLGFTTKATRAETADAYTISEVTMSADPPPHIHRDGEEAMYVLEGETEFLVGGRKIAGPPGSFVVVPRGTIHNVN